MFQSKLILCDHKLELVDDSITDNRSTYFKCEPKKFYAGIILESFHNLLNF